MIDREYTINAFSYLGKEISSFINNNRHIPELAEAINNSCKENYWFTKENILKALLAIADKMLVKEKLDEWLSNYSFNNYTYKVGLIMAGNIPLVGFHDFLCVIASGNTVVIKPSSKDKYLIKVICDIIIEKFPLLKNHIIFTQSKPTNINAVIATGSNNSARYFRSEYKDIKLLVRKNRYSIAILNGKENFDDIEALGNDVFGYFGLGCRNVSNIFVPKDYNWLIFFESLKKYQNIITHEGYSDCFRYQKAVLELSEEEYLSNGFIILKKQNPAFSSIATINYTPYNDIEQVKTFLNSEKDNIQCIVSNINSIANKIPFGYTQSPELTDYADGVDTISFLQTL